jgi:hypothetical protein
MRKNWKKVANSGERDKKKFKDADVPAGSGLV